MGALAVAVGVAGCGQRRVASGERKLRREIGQQKQSKQTANPSCQHNSQQHGRQ